MPDNPEVPDHAYPLRLREAPLPRARRLALGLPGGSSRLRGGPLACCVVTFETSGGELPLEAVASPSAGQQRAPSSLGLAMALQLSREQGITLRGSAEIVAEFFCKSPLRRPEGGES